MLASVGDRAGLRRAPRWSSWGKPKGTGGVCHTPAAGAGLRGARSVAPADECHVPLARRRALRPSTGSRSAWSAGLDESAVHSGRTGLATHPAIPRLLAIRSQPNRSRVTRGRFTRSEASGCRAPGRRPRRSPPRRAAAPARRPRRGWRPIPAGTRSPGGRPRGPVDRPG